MAIGIAAKSSDSFSIQDDGKLEDFFGEYILGRHVYLDNKSRSRCRLDISYGRRLSLMLSVVIIVVLFGLVATDLDSHLKLAEDGHEKK